jgi:hypothetical protein
MRRESGFFNFKTLDDAGSNGCGQSRKRETSRGDP